VTAKEQQSSDRPNKDWLRFDLLLEPRLVLVELRLVVEEGIVVVGWRMLLEVVVVGLGFDVLLECRRFGLEFEDLLMQVEVLSNQGYHKDSCTSSTKESNPTEHDKDISDAN
jgi:hypothetical protein